MSYSVTLQDWFYIDKKKIPQYLYESLSLSIPDENDRSPNPRIVDVPIWSETIDENGNEIIAIPRYCDIGLKLLNHTPKLYMDYSSEGKNIAIKLKVKPRDEYQEKAISSIVSVDHGICQAKTGAGKTYMAVASISKIKKKTIVFVHKTALAEQWKNDILTYTNLKEDDIEILEGPKYSLDKKIVITTVQNFASKTSRGNWDFRNEILNAGFGVVFFDEVHATAGPLKFAQASRWINAKRIYGLSATPKRGDEFDKIIKWVIGDIIYTDERPMMPVYVWFKKADIAVPTKNQIAWRHYQNSFMLKYLKWWTSSEQYNDVSTKVLYDLLISGKKILAVGAYKDILDQVFLNISKKLVTEQKDPNQVILLHGTSEAKIDNLDMDKINLIISTNKFFSDGLSIPALDTLVYLTPGSAKSESNIPQLVGRIVRTYKGKKYALVVDLYNELAQWEKARKNKRYGKYKEFGYTIVDAEDVKEFENNVKQVEDCVL